MFVCYLAAILLWSRPSLGMLTKGFSAYKGPLMIAYRLDKLSVFKALKPSIGVDD